MQPEPLPPLATRFADALRYLVPKLSACAVAVSGGSDSLALLHLLHQTHPNIRLTALTVDHQLRAESKQEGQQVAQWMAALSIPHHLLPWQHDTVEGNMQAEARKARYRLMTAWCRENKIDHLLLGHTQDDQAETIAYQQERAAGPVGLAGMSARRDEQGITLLRPLLGHSRQELQDWLRTQNLAWISDPSNQNTDFARIRLRQQLAANPQQKAELLTLGARMAGQRQQIEQRHAQFVQQHVTPEDGGLNCPLEALLSMGEEQAAYSLGCILRHIGGDDYPPRYAKRLHCLSQLASGAKRLTLGHCLMTRAKGHLHFHPEKDSASTAGKALVPSPFTPIFPS